MQPIGDYLKKLLYHYDCIVVPTLGAFLARSVPASFNEATGQFLPPRRKVAFNGALMLDDGILANYVTLHEGISREVALRGINNFVADLKQQAQQRGSFAIDGLGLFSYNAENSLQFDPELRHNFLGNAYGMQPVMLASKVVHLAQPVVTIRQLPEVPVRSIPVVSTALTVHIPAESPVVAEETRVLEMPVRRSGGVWRWVAAAMLVGSLGFIGYFTIFNPGQALQSSLNPVSIFRFRASLWTEAVSKENVPASTVKAVTVPAVAVNASAVPLAVPTRPVVVVTKPVVDVVASERASIRKSIVLVTKSTAKQAVTVDKPKAAFTVIAGSFASRRNAVRFQKRLVKEGYAEAYIMQGRGLIKVAAIGAESLAEAEANTQPLNTLTGIKPFIMRKH